MNTRCGGAAPLLAELLMMLPAQQGDVIQALVNNGEAALAAYLFLKIFKSRGSLYGFSGILRLLMVGGVIMPACAGLLLRVLRLYGGVAVWQRLPARRFSALPVYVLQSDQGLCALR